MSGNFWALAGETLGGKSGENFGERLWKALKSIKIIICAVFFAEKHSVYITVSFFGISGIYIEQSIAVAFGCLLLLVTLENNINCLT